MHGHCTCNTQTHHVVMVTAAASGERTETPPGGLWDVTQAETCLHAAARNHHNEKSINFLYADDAHI